jgi:hypothetical protein
MTQNTESPDLPGGFSVPQALRFHAPAVPYPRATCRPGLSNRTAPNRTAPEPHSTRTAQHQSPAALIDGDVPPGTSPTGTPPQAPPGHRTVSSARIPSSTEVA